MYRHDLCRCYIFAAIAASAAGILTCTGGVVGYRKKGHRGVSILVLASVIPAFFLTGCAMCVAALRSWWVSRRAASDTAGAGADETEPQNAREASPPRGDRATPPQLPAASCSEHSFYSADEVIPQRRRDEAPPAGAVVECAVCLGEVEEGDEEATTTTRRLPACAHAFHGACIERWLRERPTCPSARRGVDDGCTRDRRLPRILTLEEYTNVPGASS